MATTVKFFRSHRFIIVLAILVLGFALIACAGGSKKKDDKSAERTGSLTRTFKLIDENGLKSGTLTMDPAGGAVLRDENGKVVGKFILEKPAQTQQTEVQLEEEKSKDSGEKKTKE